MHIEITARERYTPVRAAHVDKCRVLLKMQKTWIPGMVLVGR